MKARLLKLALALIVLATINQPYRHHRQRPEFAERANQQCQHQHYVLITMEL